MNKYVSFPTKEEELKFVRANHYNIRQIENPSEELQLAAVETFGFAIEYIDNPSEAVKLAAVKNFGQAIQYIDSPSEEVMLAALNQDFDSIGCFANQISDEFITNIISKCVNISSFSFLRFLQCKHLSNELKKQFIQRDVSAIQYLINPSEELKIFAIKTSPRAFYYIKDYDTIMKTKEYWDNDYFPFYLKENMFSLTEDQYQEILQIYNTLELFK
jgi:hypothetical protein